MLVSVAAAQSDVGDGDAARKLASVHFKRGVSLFQEGAYRAALVEFQRAQDTAPDYRLLYNIGRTQLELHDFLAAYTSLERYLQQGGSEVPAGRRSEVETELAQLRDRVARLSIKVNRDGAELLVDDRLVGTSPLDELVSVNVGSHRVLARTKSGAQAEVIIDVAGGDLREVALTLSAPELAPAPLQSAQPAEARGLSLGKRLAIASFAGAGASFAGALTAGLLAVRSQDDLAEERRLRPPDGQASPQKLASLHDKAVRLARTSDALSAVTAALATTGLVVWLHQRRETRRTTSVQVGVGTLSVRGRF